MTQPDEVASGEPAKAGRLGILPKALRPPRPWNVTLVCWLGFIHAVLGLIATVVGAIVDEDLHLPDPVRPLVHTTLLSDVWALISTLIVLPFLWLLTLKGSRHARAVLVVVLFARIVFAAVLMHLANLHNFGIWIALLVVVDVVAIFLLFGGHRTSAYFAKRGELKVRPPGDYGLDVPWVPIASFVGGVACLIYSAFLGPVGMVIVTIIGMFLCVRGAFYVYASQLGKFGVWREILDSLPEPGPPRVLDVGCGRGMGVVMALQTWPQATGIGVDIWAGKQQSGNTPEQLRSNAQEAKVADRLTIRTEDMEYLSAADDSFGLVISNMTIHYAKDVEARAQAVRELYRVTAPGGQIRIVDIRYTQQYRDVLAGLGAVDATVTNCGIRGWFGGPLFASRLVSVRKPAS